jgi:hypothetical protein
MLDILTLEDTFHKVKLDEAKSNWRKLHNHVGANSGPKATKTTSKEDMKKFGNHTGQQKADSKAYKDGQLVANHKKKVFCNYTISAKDILDRSVEDCTQKSN